LVLTFIALFFVSYSVLGNATAHLTFAIVSKGYFSGLYTSFAYWILAPLLFRSIWLGSRSLTNESSISKISTS